MYPRIHHNSIHPCNCAYVSGVTVVSRSGQQQKLGTSCKGKLPLPPPNPGHTEKDSESGAQPSGYDNPSRWSWYMLKFENRWHVSCRVSTRGVILYGQRVSPLVLFRLCLDCITFSTNVVFLFQDTIQNAMSHLVVMFPFSLQVNDNF